MRIGRATVLAMAGVALALGGLNGCSSDPAPDGRSVPLPQWRPTDQPVAAPPGRPPGNRAT